MCGLVNIHYLFIYLRIYQAFRIEHLNWAIVILSQKCTNRIMKSHVELSSGDSNRSLQASVLVSLPDDVENNLKFHLHMDYLVLF